MTYKNSPNIIVKIALAVLFLLCLLKMPYGYYQLVRFIGMIGFVFLANAERDKKGNGQMIFWITSAVLINPIVKIPLGRTIWNVIDIVWAIILIATVWRDIFSTRAKEY